MAPEQVATSEPKYEAVYQRVAGAIAEVIGGGEGDPLQTFRRARTAASLAWESAFKWPWAENGYQSKAAYLEARRSAELSWDEAGERKSGSRHELDESVAALYAGIIKSHAPSDCELVLDLGCGWGHRMIDVVQSGLSARYIGGDRSLYTRACVNELAKLFPRMPLGWFQFDFLNPAFNALPDAGNILVYTCHAIEQVKVVGSGFIDRLIERYPRAPLTGVHLEPVSHQLDSSRQREARLAADRGYNLDLVSVVSHHPALEVVKLNPAVMDAGDGNTTALVVWKKR